MSNKKSVKKKNNNKKDIVVVKGWSLGTFLRGLVLGLILGGLIVFFIGKQMEPKPHLSEETDPIVDDVIEEHFTGFTAIDFQDAIMGEAKDHSELIVMEQPIKYSTTLSQEGPWKWEIFRKTKAITYHGTGVYTVNLAGIKKDKITVDEDLKIVTIKVPHAALQYVNPDFDKIEFEDTEKGLLAFTDIKLTTEQQNELEKAVRAGMEELLLDSQLMTQADEFARMKVWDVFQPIVTSVSPEYKVEVSFE